MTRYIKFPYKVKTAVSAVCLTSNILSERVNMVKHMFLETCTLSYMMNSGSKEENLQCEVIHLMNVY